MTSSEQTSLADQLSSYAADLARFVTSRKIRSSLYQGVPADLSVIQLQGLGALADSPLRIGALASRLGIAESTATRLVDRLEAHGLTRRREDPSDRRSVDVELTAAGRRVAAGVHRARKEVLGHVLERLEPDDQRELVRLFSKMVAALAEEETRLVTSRTGAGP